MLEFFMRLFRGEPSGQTAKERLRLVLLSDHLALAPEVVEALKTDLLAVISRYVEVDEAHVDVTFEQREHEVAMLANIPIRSMKDRPARPTLAAVIALPTPAAPALAADGAVQSDAPVEPATAQTAAIETPAPDDGAAPELELAPAQAPAKPRKRRRRRARAAARTQTEGGDALGTSAQA